MNLNTKLCWLLLLYVSVCFAGERAGNGGYSVVCRDQNNKIIKAELLDIYDGTYLYGLKYEVNSKKSISELRDMVLKRLEMNAAFRKKFIEQYEYFSKSYKLLPEGHSLFLTGDAFPVATEKGCGVEQLATSTKNGFFVSPDIFKSIDVLNTFALFTHEAIYKILRETGETDSVNTRFVTAYLLSDEFALSDISIVIKPDIKESKYDRKGWPACGLRGSVSERVQNCKEVDPNYKGNRVKFPLISRLENGAQFVLDPITNQVWSDISRVWLNRADALELCKKGFKEELGLEENIVWTLPTIDQYKNSYKRGLALAYPSSKLSQPWGYLWAIDLNDIFLPRVLGTFLSILSMEENIPSYFEELMAVQCVGTIQTTR